MARMTAVERLTVEVMRLSVILERVEPKLDDLDLRLRSLERRSSWLAGAAAVLGALAGALIPSLVRAAL
jgi:hypothetical protein